YYKNAEGEIHTLSPWRLVDYWSWTRRPDPREFIFPRRRAAHPPHRVMLPRPARSAIAPARAPIGRRPSTVPRSPPMIRLLATAVVSVLADAVALLITAQLLDDMALDLSGFL